MQQTPKACAGIVLYEPDIGRLAQNIAAVKRQVGQIIIVDNHSRNIDAVQERFSAEKQIRWIRNPENLGIAGALNQILDQAEALGYPWVLTLDQDSIVCENLLDLQWAALQGQDNVAMVAPYMVDINRMTLEEYRQKHLPATEEVDTCITSGTLTNVPVAKAAGGFCTKLFIDCVDLELCLRLRQNGYRVLRANRAYMLHEIGKAQMVYILPWLGRLTGIGWFLRPKQLSNHSPARVFYQSRNTVYMLRKYGAFYVPHPFRYWVRFCRGMAVRLIYEQQRGRKLWQFLKGTACGIWMKMD